MQFVIHVTLIKIYIGRTLQISIEIYAYYYYVCTVDPIKIKDSSDNYVHNIIYMYN